jgi:3-oxoacyl-[acyl-carrier-protein] synthase III
MTKMRAAITAVGGYVPEDVITNKDLEHMVDTNDEWIRSRTGIEERRILKEKGKATSDMCAAAAKEILEKRGMNPMELDLLICATITGDMVFPDTANTICDKIGAKNAYGFDIQAACSGFLFALTTGAQYIQTGMYKKVIVIGADMMSSILDYTDRSTCILFGDGAGAVLLEPNDEGYGYIDSMMGGDGSGRELLRMKAGGSLYPTTSETVAAGDHFVYQEGRSVYKAAVQGMSKSVAEVMDRHNLSSEDVDWIVPHQANLRIINALADSIGVPMEKVMVNIQKYGNTTAATLPLCLWEYEDRLEKGDKLLLTAFGGGFTWGTTYLTWAYDGLEGG